MCLKIGHRLEREKKKTVINRNSLKNQTKSLKRQSTNSHRLKGVRKISLLKIENKQRVCIMFIIVFSLNY